MLGELDIGPEQNNIVIKALVCPCQYGKPMAQYDQEIKVKQVAYSLPFNITVDQIGYRLVELH
jgi:hypothetical protein